MLVNSTTFERNISLVVGNLGKENKQTNKLHKDLFHILSTFIAREGAGGRAGGREGFYQCPFFKSCLKQSI